MGVTPKQLSQNDLDCLIAQLPVAKGRPDDLVPMDWLWHDFLPQAHDQLHHGFWLSKSTGEFWVHMSGGVAGVDVWYGPGDANLLPMPPVRPGYARAGEIAVPVAALLLSWLAFTVAVGAVTFLAWYIPRDRKVFVGLLSDFGAEPPAATKVAISIPDAVFPIAAALVCITLTVIQLKLRPHSTAFLIHLLALVACIVVWVVYRECMLQPVIHLINAVQH